MAPKAAGISLPDPPLKKKGGRISLACTNCRKRKIKCDTNDDIHPEPCGRCVKNKLVCQYLTVAEDPEAKPNSQWDPYDPQTLQNHTYAYGQEWSYPHLAVHEPTMSSYYTPSLHPTSNLPPYSMARDGSRQPYPYSHTPQDSFPQSYLTSQNPSQQALAQMYSGANNSPWSMIDQPSPFVEGNGISYAGDFSQYADFYYNTPSSLSLSQTSLLQDVFPDTMYLPQYSLRQ